jgi:hypothetical protein
VSRCSFAKEIGKLSKPLRKDGTARSLDLAKAALEIAAEDDALVSHSPVPLPVDAYIDRLESMAVEFAHHYLPARDKSPTALFEALDIYLYGYQGFCRTQLLQPEDARVFYLNTVSLFIFSNTSFLQEVQFTIIFHWCTSPVKICCAVSAPNLCLLCFMTEVGLYLRSLNAKSYRC